MQENKWYYFGKNESNIYLCINADEPVSLFKDKDGSTSLFYNEDMTKV